MAAYCAVPPDDPFAVSEGMFDALAGALAGPAAAVLTASRLEEFLDERGREVLRQLLRTTTTCARRGRSSSPASAVPR